MTPIKFVTDFAAWEDSDFIVTIRPDTVKPWEAVSIGGTLARDEAKIVSRWLQTAWPELFKLFKNVEKELTL